MSRGRGRGRGRGSGMAQMSALQSEVNTVIFPQDPSTIYPDFDLPIPREPTNADKESVALSKRILSSMENSPFYLRPPPPPKDIERYSDRYLPPPKGSDFPINSIRANLKFFPEELHSVIDSTKPIKRKKVLVDANIISVLSNFEKEEEKATEKGKDTAKENEQEEEGQVEEEWDEDLEEENDYMESYFDNGEADDGWDDDDGGGDGDYF